MLSLKLNLLRWLFTEAIVTFILFKWNQFREKKQVQNQNKFRESSIRQSTWNGIVISCRVGVKVAILKENGAALVSIIARPRPQKNDSFISTYA